MTRIVLSLIAITLITLAPTLASVRVSDSADVLSSVIDAYPLKMNVGRSPHSETVKKKSNTIIATRLARTARPDA